MEFSAYFGKSQNCMVAAEDVESNYSLLWKPNTEYYVGYEILAEGVDERVKHCWVRFISVRPDATSLPSP